MSLEILLEAAKYVEYTSEVQARGETPPEVVSFNTKRKSHTSSKPSHQNHSHNHNNNKVHSRSSHDYYSQSYSQDDLPDKRRSGGAGTREVHNKLEKNRRAHLKECFEMLKRQLPTMDERKTSNLSILHGALRYIQVLKRKEREYEHEMEKLAREKIASQQKLASLKKGMTSQVEHIDIYRYLPDQDNETTTTASECGALSDPEDDPIGPVRQIARMNRIPVQSMFQNRIGMTRPVSPDSISQSSTTSSASSEGSPVIVVDTPTLTSTSSSSLAPSTLTLNVPKTMSQVKTVSQEAPEATTIKLVCPPKPVINAKETATSTLPLVSQAKTLPYHSTTAIPATHIHFAGAPGGATSSGSLQLGGMTGVLTTPHAVQVINQASGVKVIAASPAALGSGSALLSAQNGPLRIFSPAATSSLVAMAGPSTSLAMVTPTSVAKIGQQSLVRFTTSTTSTSKNAVVAPVTLVTSTAMVNVSQLNSGKPFIINQSLTADQTGHVVGNGGKTGATLTLTTNPKGQKYATVCSNGLTYVQPKMASHILQAVSQKALTQTLVNAGVSQSGVTSLGRQLITTAIKPGTNSATSTIRNPLTQLARVTQLVTQPPIGQNVASGNQNPLIGTPITMVPASAINNQLNKVLTNSPILKTVNSVPILQQQLQLQTSGTNTAGTASVGTIKPVMVVSVPNVTANQATKGIAPVPLKQ